MTSDTKDTKMVYNSDDICTILDIKSSTLRKYVSLLKKQSYKFHINEHGHRGYLEKDVVVLRRLIQIKDTRDMTLEKAVTAVMDWVDTTDTTDRVIDKSDQNNDITQDQLKILLEEQKEAREQQERFNRELLERLDRQQDQINKRDEQLMQGIRKLQEEKEEQKQLASAYEEEQKNKKTWWKFWD